MRPLEGILLAGAVALLFGCDAGADAPAPARDTAADAPDAIHADDAAVDAQPDAAVVDASAPDAVDVEPDAALDADAPAPRPNLTGPFPYATLSEYGLFVGALREQQPAPSVLPYEVASPLWSDNAAKHRFIALPEGARLHIEDVDPFGPWRLPAHAILVKTFAFPKDLRDPASPERLVETRLLIMEEGEAGPHVTTHVYLWNEEQTEATLHAAGKVVTVGYVDTTGAQRTEPYVVPNTNQCKDCHSSDKVVRPIGLVTRQLSRTVVRDGVEVDQIDWLAAQDALSAPPPADRPGLPDPFGTAPLAERARSWLEANCAHCHSPGGEGGPSGLWLHASVDEPVAYGVCKTPVAAGPGTGGNSYDIVPGKPDESILVYRITSTNPGIKMPELPNLLPHEPGVALVRQWIEAMTPPGCPDKAP